MPTEKLPELGGDMAGRAWEGLVDDGDDGGGAGRARASPVTPVRAPLPRQGMCGMCGVRTSHDTLCLHLTDQPTSILPPLITIYGHVTLGSAP